MLNRQTTIIETTLRHHELVSGSHNCRLLDRLSWIVDRNKLKMQALRAFTLAEIIIVLGIIGVIAAMTIPNLIMSYQKEQTVTQLKKIYTELNQALKLAEVDNGSPDNWDIGDESLATTQAFVDTYIFPYIKIVKKCANTETVCWKDTVSLNNTPCGSTHSTSNNTSGLSIIAASGYSIFFSSTLSTQASPRIRFYVDIDGPNKGPGRLGRDVFGYLLRPSSNGVLQLGAWSSSDQIDKDLIITTANGGCNKNSTGTAAGIWCGDLIMVDNWTISEVYPWK